MIGGKKEKVVKQLIIEHLDKISQTLENMVLSMEHYISQCCDPAKAESYEVHLLEKEADSKRREIIEKLYLGAFMPLIRDDLIRLIAHQDKIADRAESCCDFCLTQQPNVPEEYRSKFLELMKESVRTFKPYKDAIETLFSSTEGYEATKQKIQEVNLQEEIADKCEWQLTKDIFSSSIELAHKMHLREFIFHLVAISDVTEDAADDIDRLIVKQQV